MTKGRRKFMGSATNKAADKVWANAQHRQYEARYALDSAEGVRLLLGEYHALRLRRFNGDTAASDILIDLATAIERAGLTDRQRQAVELVYFADMSQVDTAERLSVSKQTVNRLITVAAVKIARVYEKWARYGEGYSITNGEETDNDND